MSQRTLEAHYRPNWNLAQDRGLEGYNCGYAAARGCKPFAEHQRSLVWRLLENAAIDADSTVLDVGSGIGGPASWIAERFRPRRLIGVEYLWSSVSAAAVRSNGGVNRPIFVQGDAHSLPLADGSVDLIFNLESALHYSEKRRFIGECRRVLRPGGFLCLGDITTRFKLFLAPARLLNFVPTQFNSNVRLWSARDYRRAFDDHSFECVHHEEASRNVAFSLADGIAEIMDRGLSTAHGYRARVFYLAFLEKLLRWGGLQYDLFTLRRSR